MQDISALDIKGSSHPLGATVYPHGINFSVFSKNATAVELLLFENTDDIQPIRTIPLDPVSNRTYHYWHIFVPGLQAGQIYGYRVNGPYDRSKGMRFDPSKILLDPYGRGVVVPGNYDRQAIVANVKNASAMKSVAVDIEKYDWQGDAPLKHQSSRTIIYEMHVKGFTCDPNSGVSQNTRGTYAGLIEKIPYLKQLGITAVELLPVFQFDAQACPPGLVNYWGYQPVSFFAPHQAYSSRRDPLGPIDEFRDMVKALHRADIEVILDVVFNHTAEVDDTGPTLCFRGLDNSIYYILRKDGGYADFTGCGNTLNANNPILRRMIVDSIRYWVQQMHVDGFRFDLASILARDASGNLLANPPVLWDIETDPVLAGTKFIAEAWDAAGLYQVGSFIGDSWKEWNGRFRDDVRRFLRSEDGTVATFADRLIGSPQVYGHEDREMEQSVNFVACHDGFTLNDLVCYNNKHNETNGQENRDGTDQNFSWNCGIEGPSDDPSIEKLRMRQIKNFLTITMMSLGVPMILMGDEVRRTQKGNNNAYCFDNENNWFDWQLVTKYADLHRFVRLLIARRSLRDIEHEEHRMTLNQMILQAKKAWHGIKLDQPDWGHNSHSLAFTVELKKELLMIHLIFNAYWHPLDFQLPQIEGSNDPWRRWIDTSLDSPNDIVDWLTSPPISDVSYHADSHSTVILWRKI